jgi:hypothetical protein
MRLLLPLLLALFLLSLLPAAWAEDVPQVERDDDRLLPDHVRRNYFNTSRYLISSHAIVLEGTPRHIRRISQWLDQIASVPYGRVTLEAIFDSGNQVTIRHSEWALQASGRTLAPVSSNLTNGLGEDVVILFDVRIPDQGSHRVFDTRRRQIEFTAVQNLFHELAHARHLTNGTWRYSDSEGQAIAEENRFRQELSERNGEDEARLRSGIDGQQFWYPDRGLAQSGL